MRMIPRQLQPVLTAVQEAGGRPQIVGGAVRDTLLGLESKDIDVEVYGIEVDQLAAALAPFGRINAVGRSFGILKLRLSTDHEIDFALPQRHSRSSGQRGVLTTPDPHMDPREAAARRDFTWNAMAITPEGEVLDFFGGEADLHARIIRHTSPAFDEDPLRVLRAMQFAARFDMRLAPETAARCRALLPMAQTLPIERIWGEWWKWATAGAIPSAGLRALQESGWIDLYPEIGALIGCPQDPHWHPEGDVFTHTGYVCDAAATIARREELTGESRATLLLAALCHDLGKPATTYQDEEGRTRSPGHAQAGSKPAEALLHRIGCVRTMTAAVLPLVREHMAHLGLAHTQRSVRRLAARLKPATIALWGRLVEADHSGRPPLPAGAPAAPIVALARQIGVETSAPAPILRGRHALALGVAPGPALGRVLRNAYRAQLDGAFSSEPEGLEWLARTLKRPT